MNATASRLNSYSDNNNGLNSDEEEEERRLSEQYGEAADDDDTSPSSKRKRGGRTQQNTTLTEEDAAAAKEFEEKIRRKRARPVLTPTELKGEKGLVFVRRSFPTLVKKFRSRDLTPLNKVRGTGVRSNKLAQRLNTNAQINAAAQYSRSLMGAYRDFGHELFPSLAVEDVFLKIEDLGKKKEVKDYMQIMREDFRKEYLEGIYGGEKAGRILTELQYGLRAMHPMKENYGSQLGGGGAMASRIGRAVDEETDEVRGMDILPPVPSPERSVVANPYAKKDNDDVGSEREGEEKSNETTVDVPMADAAMDEKNQEAIEEDEEEEATFSINGDNSAANNTASDLAKDDSIDSVAAEEQNDTDKSNAHSKGEPNGFTKEKRNDVVENTNEICTDKPAESAIGKQDGVVEKTEKSNSDELTVLDAENQDVAIDTADIINTEFDSIEQEADESEPLLKTQETTATTFAGDGNSSPEIACDTTDDVVQNEEEESPPHDKTQETLTLMESQFDDVVMEYTQDERFSQAGTINDVSLETPTQLVEDDDVRFSQTQDERFSQTQDERFSQTLDDAGAKETQDGGFSQEEENTAEERFSQFTQGSRAVNGPIFEEDGNAGDNVGDYNEAKGNGNGRDQLGQTMDTQLSMEY